jgi:hypothetical protein
MPTPSVTIGWFPRERFTIAAESLETLLAHSPSCPLIIVDPATPPRYMHEIKKVLGDHPAEVIHADHPLLPAVSKNLILDRVKTDYVALVENDVLFTPGWLEGLLAACEQEPADVAAPIIYDGREKKNHFDKHLGEIRLSESEPGKREVIPLKKERNSAQKRERVHFVEQHCLLFRTKVFECIGRFDEQLNTRDEVDLSVALYDAGCTVVLEPATQIHYVPPTSRPDPDELPFYLKRWDLDRAVLSRERIRERWNLVDTPGDLGFVQYRNLIARLPEVRRDLEALTDPSQVTLLLEDGDWWGTDITDNLAVKPFPELNGHFGGFPASESAAIEALDRELSSGVTRVVVGYPAFWWFDYLPGLQSRLEKLDTVRQDSLMRVFDVRKPNLRW